MKTKIEDLQDERHAGNVAFLLRLQLLPRRGYRSIYSEGCSVFVVSDKQPSYDFNRQALTFIAGYKAALAFCG